MTCQDMMDLMQSSLDSDLSDAEERTLHAHLQGCPDCADLYERLKLLTGELAQLPKVTPPYSIVDSILPQLEGLGGLAEPGAAADLPAGAAGSSDELAVRREKKGIISWKIVSGVAAAGIVLGMWIFNGGAGRLDNKAAEEIAGKLHMSNSAAESGSAPKQQDTTANAFTAAPPSPEAVSGSSPGAAATPAASAPAAQTETAVRDDKPVSMASLGDGSVQQHMRAADQAGGSAGQARGDTPAAKDLPAEGTGAGAAAAANTPEAAAVPPAAKKQAPETTASPAPKGEAADQAPMGLLAAPERTPAAEEERGEEAGALADTGRSGVYGLSATKTAPAVQPMTSEDGVYTAALVELSVTVTAKDGTEIFRSGVQMAAGDVMTFHGWKEGGVFSYSIKKPDGKETTYRISATDKKESVQ